MRGLKKLKRNTMWQTNLKAWWWRNIKYRDKTFELLWRDCRHFKLFDILCAREGGIYIYIGKNKFIEKRTCPVRKQSI